ncbi:BRO-N domain-containing protein [Rhodoplanes roseus]|uniref:BRO-N domain-containing protein n=1 Tax=Rhodoplanes roseus TaxID=29409 RepID=UPI001474D4B8|nr:BRO family protein [Rhodoplanes roseus]
MSIYDFTALIEGLETTHKVRVVTLDGAPWFVGGDVCAVLGLRPDWNTYRALHDDEHKSLSKRACSDHALFPGRAAWVHVLSEPGLFRLVMRSDKPIARPFQDWVVREVLPAIRKTGGYVLAGADPAAVEVGATEMMPLPATFTEALRQHAATLIRLAEEQEAHAKTEAERQAAVAAKALAKGESRFNRIELTDRRGRPGETGTLTVSTERST